MQKRLLIILLAAVLFGCAERPVRQAPQADSPLAAEQAMSEGRYEQAAQLYIQLAAKSQPPAAYEYRYLAAQALFRGGFANQASEQLQLLPEYRLAPELGMRVQLLRAEIPLKRDPELTLLLLQQPAAAEQQLADAAQPLYARFHQLRARALAHLGRHLDAAREYIVRELYLQQPEQIEDNQLAIWQSLSLLGPQQLARHEMQPPPDVLSGWLELVGLSRDYSLTPTEVQQRLRAWRQRYPGHPASETLLQMLLKRSQELAERPANIALLLPLSGRFGPAAQAIQDGLLAAYYQDPLRSSIALRIYDSGDAPWQAQQAYQLALREGAEFVIGPLDKEAVAQLGRESQLPVPTLALNYAGPAGNDQLYQFTLSPEDEAREVAERAWQEGYTRATVLVPKSTLGERLATAFAERWQELGGSIASESRFDSDGNDFSIPIKTALNINDSEFRKRRINQLIAGRVEFIPRRRQDVDFIFLAAFPRQARLLRPQLKFHHAGDLSIFATSHLYSGELKRDADRDMDGIQFCDMPWTLGSETPQQALREAHSELFQRHTGQLQRLVALGVDAYQLVPLLPVLAKHSFEHYRGETGKLSVDAQHRIQRQLQWAEFHRGIPQLQEERVLNLDTDWQESP